MRIFDEKPRDSRCFPRLPITSRDERDASREKNLISASSLAYLIAIRAADARAELSSDNYRNHVARR